MITQKEIFLSIEGDHWFDRNKPSFDSTSCNLVVDLLNRIELKPTRVLEIGCSNGFRLKQLQEAFACECFGIDPSVEAIKNGSAKYHDINLSVGTADDLRYDNDSFDTVIFGFCLYCCDRKDLFRIAYQADRVLRDEGIILITDFSPPFPFKNRYLHHEDVFCYKMDYGQMFTWNPAYTEYAKIVYSHSGFKMRDIPNERVATIVLRKNEQYAFPEEPYRNNV